MNADTDYIEMAQLLGDASLPGEALTVLDKAMSTGVVKDEHKERTPRPLNSLKTRADADRRGLPQEAAEAIKHNCDPLENSGSYSWNREYCLCHGARYVTRNLINTRLGARFQLVGFNLGRSSI